VQRRDFLKTAAVAGTAVLLQKQRAFAQSADAHIEVLLNEPIGQIAPEIYGHFTEQLGGVIYDGVWVGEGSKIANQGGIRSALIEKLRAIKAPIIRWPGGCFADSYDWKDGLGPHAKRPVRSNFWIVDDYDAESLHGKGVQLYEDNAFGTDEFVRFCKLSGAEPYFASNLRSLPALEFDHWVEYCNSPAGSTTLAKQRAANGSTEPYNVRYWGVGNESWGCGGNFTPEDYASEYRRFTAWVPSYGQPLRFVGSGPNDDDVNWTHRFFEKLTGGRGGVDPRNLWGWSAHHYSWNTSRGRTQDWITGKGDALQFEIVDWYEILHESDFTEDIIRDQWVTLAQYDREHRVKLVFDEYGPWYKKGTELDPTHMLGQQITMRDAVATALTLDIFNRHAEKIGMAACAQLINNLNALFLAHKDNFIVTPNYYVFEMYAAHQGAQAVRAEFSAPQITYDRDGKQASFWGLKGSASVSGKILTLTVVNPDAKAPHEASVTLRGGSVSNAQAVVLAASDIHAHNTFDHPKNVGTEEKTVAVQGSTLRFTFPPASVTKISATLG